MALVAMFRSANLRSRIVIGWTLLLCAGFVACDLDTYPAAHTFPNVKVQFVNERTGWIVGPKILRTRDGGNTWTIVRADGPATIVSEMLDNEQRRIQFVDERLGFFLGRARSIYKTADGGETWTETAAPVVDGNTENFHTIFFRSSTSGWVVGKNVYRTDDGATWSRLGPTPLGDETRMQKPAIAEGYPPAMSFLDDRTIVLVRKDGDVHRSTDGGATWQRVWSVNNYLHSVYFLNDKAGWIVGANGFLGRTTDSGVSWEQIKVPASADLIDVFFLNEKKGWAVGRNGTIIYTIDGGLSWLSAQVKPDVAKAYLADVYFIDEKRGWVVGGEPFNDMDLTSQPSNLILETQDGGLTWVQRNF